MYWIFLGPSSAHYSLLLLMSVYRIRKEVSINLCYLIWKPLRTSSIEWFYIQTLIALLSYYFSYQRTKDAWRDISERCRCRRELRRNIAISAEHVRAPRHDQMGASGGFCRGLLAWPRVISNDVPPLQPSDHPLESASALLGCLAEWNNTRRFAGGKVYVNNTQITSSHACLLFSRASTVLIRAGCTRRRTWILMLAARNGHFSSGNRLPTLCETMPEERPRPWRGIWLSPTRRRDLDSCPRKHTPRFDPLMSLTVLVIEYGWMS